MIGLDTNVLVRYIMQDDAKQSARANRLIDGLTPTDPGYITVVSVIELVWVLSSSYELNRGQVARALDALIHSKQIVVAQAEHIVRALRVYQSGSADFADCLIERMSASAGCTHTYTFDKAASKVAGMTLVPSD